MAILLLLIAFLSFFGCNKPENETPLSLMITNNLVLSQDNPDITTKSGETMSSTGIPVVDLGIGCAYGVNSMGKVVGVSWPQDSPHAYLWFRRNDGKDLGCLGYPEFSGANDINDLGQVVGSSWLTGETCQQRAFLWSDKGGMVDLGVSGDPAASEEAFSYAFGINNRGDVVGEVDCYGFLWTNKRGMVLLNTPEPLWKSWSTAWDINDYGLIVGTSSYITESDEKRVYHAKLWTDVGKMLDLGTILERQYSVALGINAKVEIVGGCNDVTEIPHERIGNGFDPSNVAFLWTEQNGMSQLPDLVEGDAGFASANAINDLGMVVGWSSTAEGKIHAVVWTGKDSIKDLGTLLPDDVESVAYGINNLGQIVGYSTAENRAPHAVIWTLR